MRKLQTLCRAFLMLGAVVIAHPAAASDADQATIERFYEILSNAGSATQADLDAIMVGDWESIPTPRGGAGADGFLKSLDMVAKGIPDFKIVPQAILRDGDTFIVRSIATGTPPEKFFGKPTNGNSFEIMTIDIHRMVDGKMVQSWHIEEWMTAYKQVTTK